MTVQEVIQKILEAGIKAPSGENCQPWLFKIDGERVTLWNNPESDQSLYNYHQSGSFVAHGALLENIAIAATAYGYMAEIKLFPESSDPNMVATITFQSKDLKKDLLEPSINRRSTNRKPYDGSPLSETEKKELLGSKDANSWTRLLMTEDREKIATLAKASSLNEQFLIENPEVHDFFFSHVRWTEEENRNQPNGFYIKTLELKPPQVAGFKLFRHPRIARFFARIGGGRQVGAENEKIYNTASLIVAVVAKGKTAPSLVAAGRTLERLWLTVTELGLSAQPMAGALFLAESAAGDNAASFSEVQREALKGAKESVYKALGIDPSNEHIAVLLRVGRGGEPSARAARFPLETFLQKPLMHIDETIGEVASDRQILIKHILNDLATLRGKDAFVNQYAVEENIAFFEAIKSFPRYIKWLIRRAPKLDRSRLLELTDLPFPRWDREMHLKLIEVESRDFPGLVKPLVEKVSRMIFEKKDGVFISANLGCGAMEVERQIMKEVINKSPASRVVLVGIDISPVAHEIAEENLREVGRHVAIHKVDVLDEKNLKEILQKETRRHIIILCRNDIFKLSESFSHKSFDAIYHTLFKHHLAHEQKTAIDSIIVSLSSQGIEYDGYKSWPHLLLPHTLTAWKYPAFLNGSIFSDLRYFTKNDLRQIYPSSQLSFYGIGTYLRVYNQQ